MAVWYALTNYLLPFEWAQHVFMQNALITVLLVTPLFGLLGTAVVNHKMAFYSEALGHSALTGIAIGVILGLKNPLLSMVFFSILLAIGISTVKSSGVASTDTIIAVFSSAAVALGIVILSRGGGFNKYSGYLIGDFLSISPNEISMLAAIFVVVLILWAFIYNKLLLVSINQSLAHSRGINVRLFETLFAIIMAVTVTISIQWVGLLIITSLLVLPAAAARNISKNVRQYTFLAVLITVVSGISGLIFSYYWGTATGATIVLIAACFYIVTFLLKPQFN
ncbi:MAG: metal ABC transporter permease [Thermincola sp.]|jgi:zinc transport system permease protein|nr:metal ABC transporter permease [Thermincola sp.]MDT3703124.1 metal ABC transporter permease [Thermincola sp.]